MAVLVEADRKEIWAEFMRRLSRDREQINLDKNALRAAFDAVDDWIEANQASYNTALPVVARTNLTPKQKAELLIFVINKRFKVI